MDAEIHAKLRAPFPAEAVGKLPRVWCGKCREAIKNKRWNCDEHQRSKCRDCNNNMTVAHLHLDYIGHAAVTDRLLQVDTSWAWEPLALDEHGLPAVDRNGGLWIRLTVAGVTRLGYGDAAGKQGADAVKEVIGDALRNAAMRFGVALDLWHKDGVLPQDDDAPAAAAPHQQRTSGQQRPAQPAARSGPDPVVAARQRLAAVIAENKWSRKVIETRYSAATGHELGVANDAAVVEQFTNDLFAVTDEELRAPAAANGATR